MNASEADKAWLRRITNTPQKAEYKADKHNDAEQEHAAAAKKVAKGNGLRDVAGMAKLKELVTEGFINVLNNGECAKAYGIKPPSMLLYGPAGCGKTFFAEKMAEEVGIHFMKIVPDDLACTWVHGTQQKIGEVFKKAEKAAPTLLFFDEFDAMVPKRSGTESSQHYDSEVNEFLCMLSGAADRGIYVLAATNHPERIDKAVLRTGRIDEMIYVDMPDADARKSLFDLALSRLPADSDIDTCALASLTKGYNCSDICYVTQAAARKMFCKSISADDGHLARITQKLLEEIISSKSPSVSSKDLREYERVRQEFSPDGEGRKRTTIGFK